MGTIAVLSLVVTLGVVAVVFLARSGGAGPKPVASVADPVALRGSLVAAFERGDDATFHRLCRENEQAIVDAFPAWAKRDPALGPPNRKEIDDLVQFLGTLAQHMDSALGRPEPWRTLTGPPGESPIALWQKDVARAKQLCASKSYPEALALLHATLERTQSLEGTAADELMPLTHGCLGAALFHTGEVANAKRSFEKALAGCVATGDGEGVRAYHASLFEAERYLGEPKAAAIHAEALAQIFAAGGDLAEAEWYARQARIVAEGEPKNRIVGRIDGRTYEIDDLPQLPIDVRISFEFRRDRLGLGGCDPLLEDASALARAGDLDAALDCWRAATAIDPFDPQPHYESGVALLEQGRFAEASAAFERTELLAPGWFLCRHYAWLARELTAGRLDAWAVSAALAVRDDAPGTPDEKGEIASEALSRAPGFAWMHCALGRALSRSGDHEGAERALREGLTTASEPCFQTDLLFELARVLGPTADERDDLLFRAIRLNGSLMSAAAARVLRKRQAP